ncbi:MAG TPA: DUF1598 domain-containing protein [Pirellulales bacterium]|nr:DUF1598 domain-containing protein [Pirellulales bacterium]
MHLWFVLGAGLWVWQPAAAVAQRSIGGSVGGVQIDPQGLLQNSTVAQVTALAQLRQEALEPIAGDLKRPTELRKISLRRLEAEAAEWQKVGRPPSDTMRYLAGLQRIRYVFVYPEQNDIVIAGFAEGWKIDARGNTIGASTGRPCMLLDDLIVALRAVRLGGGMSCSIDPTPEGLVRLREYVAAMTGFDNPQREAQTIEQLLGPQTITITGVPATSHFARIMVVADYRMKRLGMKLDPPPIPGLLSYVDMIRPGTRGMQSMTPRWWMVPNYEPLLTDAEGLAWEIRGASVKALTEETFFGNQGSKAQTGKVNPIAQAWATNFTARYDDLSLKDTVFGQLRNCMDLAVLAALIVRQDLGGKAGYQLPLWLDEASLPAIEMAAPRTTDTEVSFNKKGNNWVITASGGVQLVLDDMVQRVEKSDKIDPVRQQAKPAAGAQLWWWD